MKKLALASALIVSFIAGTAMAEKMKDWHDLDAVHNKIVGALSDMNRARQANHYDMSGHGAKAEQFLHQAEGELKAAVDAAKSGK